MAERNRKYGRTPLWLANRRAEHDVLAELVNAVRGGTGRALVVSGEPGIGKSLMLDHAAELAVGLRVVRVTGVQSEMELPFAGLHQLSAPVLSGLEALTAPQRDALRIAFGLSDGPTPDRFLVGLAVLGLLSEAAGEQPLLCVVDDHQWLDQASAQALGFIARRLAADPVGLVFGTREPGEELAGLPELNLRGLNDDDAGALLDSVLTAPLDTRIRDQIIAETGGNPLALLELPRGLSAGQLAGGFGLPGVVSVSGRIEESFLHRLEALPPQSRRLLQLAAADPSGDAALVWRAAAPLGIPICAAAGAAENAGLVEFTTRVRFRHPLLRSAAYRSASAEDRQAIHLALAEATDPVADPDRRAWHRAQGASGPDEAIAAELEASAGRALARGGLAAAAAFLQRAVVLSVDPVRRAERILSAAEAGLKAGAFSTALDLLDSAEARSLDELQGARVDLLRGRVGFASALGGDTLPMLLKAAQRLEPLDRDLARDTYLTAWMAAVFAGRRGTGTNIRKISGAAQNLRPPESGPVAADRALHALTLLVTEGPAAAVPALREIVTFFTGTDVTTAERLHLGWFAQAAASALWDLGTWRAMLTRQARHARNAGALDQLPILLAALGVATLWEGDFAAADALLAESDAICTATGTSIAPFIPIMAATLRGDEEAAQSLITAAIADGRAQGQGVAEAFAQWNGAILHNSLGRYDQAAELAAAAAEDSPGLYVSLWALPELVEATARSGRPDHARAALDRLERSVLASGEEPGLGIAVRSRALLTSGAAAERLYREAIDRLGRTALRPELARAHLVYGEWLRRENRRVDARAELRTAHDMLVGMGAAAFADRARRELLACGETARKRTVGVANTLTAQEAFIARLAADGHTNPEIGAQLFISARTVEWHLRNVFAKLGISSRRELGDALDTFARLVAESGDE
ncbi:ATP-binding protein [Streptomyces sp. NPDC051286]|uniref:ATP-binding protein n=1 Tax=Streptomyces sp. NPDC051286 TaxID=3365647 RepID=UPI0037A92263